MFKRFLLSFILCFGLFNVSALADTEIDYRSPHDVYKPYARRTANAAAKRVEMQLEKQRLHFQTRGDFSDRAVAQELQDFLKWLLNESGLLVNPVTDLPKLKEAFMTFLLLCYNDQKTFASSVGVITAIATKYITYASCYYFVPPPANLVAPGLICAPIGYGVGKFSGYQFGKWVYNSNCLD